MRNQGARHPCQGQNSLTVGVGGRDRPQKELGIILPSSIVHKHGEPMPSSLEIAAVARLDPIAAVAAQIGIPNAYIEPYGRHKAKIDLTILDDNYDRPMGKLIL